MRCPRRCCSRVISSQATARVRRPSNHVIRRNVSIHKGVFEMERVLATIMVGGALLSPIPAAVAQSAQAALAPSAVTVNGHAAPMLALPPLPGGKSTVLGGSIRGVDPVRDQLVLDVYGEKPMKVLYDERTQIFRDGKRISL